MEALSVASLGLVRQLTVSPYYIDDLFCKVMTFLAVVSSQLPSFDVVFLNSATNFFIRVSPP